MTCKVQYTYIIKTKGLNIDDVFQGFYSKLKSEIRYAQKSNYRIDSDISFDQFYSILNKTFLRQGSKAPFSKSFLNDFIKNLETRSALKIIAIKDDSENIMAVVGLLVDQNSTSLLLNGINDQNIKRGANELLIYESIKFATQHSCVFDFEGSMMYPINSFYRKFGGELTPFFKVYRNNIFNYMLEKAISTYKRIKYGK